MALRGPRQLLAVVSCAVIAIGACTSDRTPTGPVVLGESPQDTHDHGKTANVSQDLSAGNFQGTSLPAKTLALTFDDGPGPRTKELSIYLKSVNIKAAFFMNGARLAATALPNPNGITVVADPAGTLAQVLADGHLVANHTTTHRDLTSQVPDAQRVQELSDTDTDIAGSVSPQNHLLFRAPYGAYDGAVFTTLSASTMNKYVGPIYWEAGGFSDQFPNRAADWACWQGAMKDGANTLISVGNDPGYATTTQCGDAYVKEIDNDFPKGIVLMHDPYSWSKNGSSGSTVDMVKYIVPILIGKGYSFVRVDDVPDIAAALPPPPCHATCATCSGPSANECTACLDGRYKSGGQCLVCSTCSASQYQVSACSTNADTACAACSATCGTCTGPSDTECASCTANKYLGGGACTACSVCGTSTYQSAACTSTANTVCGACDASCAACSGPNPNQCGSCPTAFFLGGGSCNACKVCETGSFQAAECTTTANALCTACTAGSFTKVAGATTCTKCEPGTTSAVGAMACIPCPAGTTASAAGATSCTPCAAGTFAAAGAATCSACAAGTTSALGAAACTACGNCGVDSGTSGGLRDDVEGGPTQPAASDNGCSITGQLGTSGSGSGHGARGLFLLAALGMSRLVRRRKSARQHTT